MGYIANELKRLRQERLISSGAEICKKLEQRSREFRFRDRTVDGASGLFTLEGIKELEVNANKMRKASKKTSANELLAEFYSNYYKENYIESERPTVIKNCFRSFDIDYYRLQQVKVIKKAYLCHDKFCLNCQNQISEHRYAKFAPYLQSLTDEGYAVYHVVLTVPNCLESILETTLDKMYKMFAYLIRYFEGTKGSRVFGDYFKNLGFYGAVRALEVGVKQKGFLTEMHPHFHCLFIFDKPIKNVGYHLNTYSYKRADFKRDRQFNNGKRFFTDFEILIQKLWYMIYNGQKVTKKSFNNLDLGYSCSAQRVIKDYKEVFKYSMKGMYDPKTSQFTYSENTFRYLLEAMHRRKIIQGYKELNHFKFDDEDISNDIDEYFAQRIIALRQIEDPLQYYMSIFDILKEMEEQPQMLYISKNSLKAKVDARAGGKQ